MDFLSIFRASLGRSQKIFGKIVEHKRNIYALDFENAVETQEDLRTVFLLIQKLALDEGFSAKEVLAFKTQLLTKRCVDAEN